MKTRALPLVFLILFAFHACTRKKDAYSVEGLLYLDGKPVSIEIIDGKIAEIKHLLIRPGFQKIYLAPGLIDIQINGYMGVSFADQYLTMERMREATMALWKEGVTSYLPTLITRDHERLVRSFSLLAKALDDEVIGMSIPGFHLEGPYISPIKGYRGAHLERFVRLPDWDEFSELQKTAQNGIKLITVAPEMEGAIPFIKKCNKSGMVVSLGHHNGTPEIIEQAVDAGASLSTHLGNGCANEINRHHNPLWPQLANDGLSISIIVDGSHLTKDEVRTFYKVKGVDRTILVSDAVYLAGLPPGNYYEDGITYLMTKDVVKYPAENVLAGAAQPISNCISNVMRYTQCDLKDAIQMASTNPARLMGLTDLGEISEGKRADLILFTIEHDEIVIQKTIVAGKVVYSNEQL
ncbi:MAG: N-acetylglucosamine-6-phosphate deacetylase [Bacteroidota bacterium]|nr:N-acetylglucosamine-6-phosphate deacetylase [Bacteroidota bacterium]